MLGLGRVSEEIEVKAIGGVFEGAEEGHAYRGIRNLLEGRSIGIPMGRYGIPRMVW